MNGPQHYREAERLIVLAEERWETDEAEHDALLRNAQVHATLALVAATASPIVKDWLGDEDRSGSGWTGATT